MPVRTCTSAVIGTRPAVPPARAAGALRPRDKLHRFEAAPLATRRQLSRGLPSITGLGYHAAGKRLCDGRRVWIVQRPRGAVFCSCSRLRRGAAVPKRRPSKRPLDVAGRRTAQRPAGDGSNLGRCLFGILGHVHTSPPCEQKGRTVEGDRSDTCGSYIFVCLSTTVALLVHA